MWCCSDYGKALEDESRTSWWWERVCFQGHSEDCGLGLVYHDNRSGVRETAPWPEEQSESRLSAYVVWEADTGNLQMIPSNSRHSSTSIQQTFSAHRVFFTSILQQLMRISRNQKPSLWFLPAHSHESLSIANSSLDLVQTITKKTPQISNCTDASVRNLLLSFCLYLSFRFSVYLL